MSLEKMLLDLPAANPVRRDPKPAQPSVTAQGATPADVRRTLRLQIQSLTDSDIAKIATFLRIGRERLRCDWEIAFGGDLHVLPPGASFRLRGWPPTAALLGQRHHLRMASCMSAQHVDINELARWSNAGRAQCEEFLAALLAQGLLDVRLPTATPAQPETHAGAPADAPPLPDTSLFGKIRRGLGLTRLR